MPDAFQCSPNSSKNPRTSPTRPSGQKEVYMQAHKVVLVMVDDDEDDCYLLEAALKDARFNCTFRCVQNGLEIMDYLERSGQYQDPKAAPYPDLIFLDLNLPLMNGREVLARLKTDPRFRSIPVIILTTSCDIEDVKVCYDLGANSYIIKQAHFEGPCCHGSNS
jgi:CheY-like chemotaxis protein